MLDTLVGETRLPVVKRSAVVDCEADMVEPSPTLVEGSKWWIFARSARNVTLRRETAKPTPPRPATLGTTHLGDPECQHIGGPESDTGESLRTARPLEISPSEPTR